jgi:uncharacterized caspase-like protein
MTRSQHSALLALCFVVFGCAGSRPVPVAPNDPRFRSFIFEPFGSVASSRPQQQQTDAHAERAQPSAEEPARPTKGASHPNWIALIVGIEGYSQVAKPAGARRDAEQFSEFVQTAFGVPRDRIRVLLDDQATRNRIEQGIGWLMDNASRHGTIIFYFSGHGGADRGTSRPEPAPFLMPYDADALDIVTTAIAVPDLVARLQSSASHQVVAFLDACYSGTGGRSVASKNRSIVRERSLGAERTAVFSAAHIDQVAGPNARGDRGLFTSTVITGLSGLAADIDGDRNVTLQELADWVSPRVERDARRTRRNQTPYLSTGADVRPKDVVLVEGLIP